MDKQRRISVEARGDGWVVRVEGTAARPQVFVCQTRAMADQLAKLLERMPPPR